MDLHALHILSAYIKDKADFRKELLRSLVMSHRLYLACVYFVRSLDEALAVARNNGPSDESLLRKRGIYLRKHLLYNGQRIALVVAVVLIQELLVFIY